MLLSLLLASIVVAATANENHHNLAEIIPYMGTNGPYLAMGDYTSPPKECRVDQVLMFARHNMRYPLSPQYDPMLLALNKLKHSENTGPLEFVKDFKMFMEEFNVGQLTPAGHQASETFGKEFKMRYSKLFDGGELPRLFSGNNSRDIFTAREFAKGLGFEQQTAVKVVGEDGHDGADTITPERSCNAPIDMRILLKSAHFLGANDTVKPILERISKHTNATLTLQNIISLMDICPFEVTSTSKGSSPFCDLFTKEEWKVYDYFYNVNSFYFNGPSDPMTTSFGSVFATAASQLFEHTNYTSSFVFMHDNNVRELAVALGLVNAPKDLPLDNVPEDYGGWNGTRLTPMGARLVLEKLKCGKDDSTFVRPVLNELPVAMQSCQTEYGCPLANFTKYAKSIDNFAQACVLPKTVPQRLEFLFDQPGR